MIDLNSMSVQEVTLLVVGVLLSISFITAIISLILETDRTRQWYGDWFQGVSTEMVGAAMTTIFFTFIVGTVEQREATMQRQVELIEQLGSTVNSEAIRAVEELRDEGWLRDGTLQNAELYSTDLTEAQLFGADLSGAILFDASLRDANLEGGNLNGSNLQGADLRGANLKSVDLGDSNLNAASLAGADLSGANLRGANLADASLENATLTGVLFDTTTRLPDAIFDSESGTFAGNWTPDTDLRRFTNPEHPDFWQPEPPYPWWYETPPDTQ